MCDVKLESQDENAEDQSLPGIIIPKDGFVVCATYGVDMKGLCSSMYSSMFLFFFNFCRAHFKDIITKTIQAT